MRIFYNQSADAFARRLIPGIAVAALAAWGISSGGAMLEEIPDTGSGTTLSDEVGSGSAIGAADSDAWQDGTWTGTAPGYGGDVTVSVTIADKKMTALEVVSAAGETPSFFSKAKAIIPKILEAQNPDVDVISGATYSSNGIKNATKNALTKASGGTVTETTGSSGLGSSTTGGSGTTTTDDAVTGTFKDGTFTGSAQGFGGTITVSVTISGGKITAVNIVSASGETASYFAKAKTLISKIVANQGTSGVDVVSGATYSSNGILNAVNNALKKALTTGSTTPDTDDTDDTDDETVYNPDRTYTDGTYSGTAEGYGGDVTVNVTILNQRIDAVDVVSAEDETPTFFTRARGVITSILKYQTYNVDVVSGATYSSNGIKNAVKEALDKAAGTWVDPTPETPDPDPTPEPGEEVTTTKETYTATTTCSPDEDEDFDAYEMTVTFTVTQTTTVKTDDDGNQTTTVKRELTNIEVTNLDEIDADNHTYIERAITKGRGDVKGLLTQIQEKSSLEVDVVTRATCTSNAVLEAAKSIQDKLNLGTTTTED